MKSIHTLIPDIYSLVGGEDGLTDAITSHMASDMARALQSSFGKHESRGLRLSGLGDKCPRALWYSINHPELAEPLPPYAKIKYAYGHIIEHLVIGLAKAAGHTVEGEQDEIIVDGILGHRDAVVDGAVVDFKSTATRSFVKFRDKTLAQDDPFGYLDQIDAYVLGSMDDPLVLIKDRGFIVAVDKQLGHVACYEHTIRPERLLERIRVYKEIVRQPSPPDCTCETENEENGNVTLGTTGSYSPYKYHCFPGLRTFIYSGGPKYLVKVVKRPMYRGIPLTEVDKAGKIVYN